MLEMVHRTAATRPGEPQIPPPSPRTGAERRREKRYEVDLPGTMQANGVAWSVTVSDLSASGALVSVPAGVAWVAGPDVVLVVEEFGPIEARIVHVGDGFHGLRFVHPHLHRDRLSRWLHGEVGA